MRYRHEQVFWIIRSSPYSKLTNSVHNLTPSSRHLCDLLYESSDETYLRLAGVIGRTTSPPFLLSHQATSQIPRTIDSLLVQFYIQMRAARELSISAVSSSVKEAFGRRMLTLQTLAPVIVATRHSYPVFTQNTHGIFSSMLFNRLTSHR